MKDPVVTDLLVRQRRTLDATKRREIIHEIQRHLAKQQYYVQTASGVYVAVWDRASRTTGPTWAMTTAGGSWLPGSIGS